MNRTEFVATLGALGISTSATTPETRRRTTLRLQYLGTAGWAIRSGSTTVLVDPYISRINGPPPPGSPRYSPPGDSRPAYHWDDVAVADERAIDSRIVSADYLLVTHTHYDHVLDVPYIARKTGAVVIGTESTQNVMRTYDVPERNLLTVRGGEDYEFGSLSIKVVPSLHSPLDHKHYFSSAVAPPGLKEPLTLRQIHPEGGTLAYLVRFSETQVLVFGSMNYIETEIDGLRPDVVIAGAGQSRRDIYRYTDRLMQVLHKPELVLPTHWDNFLAPYGASQAPALKALEAFAEEVKAASPETRMLVPRYFEMIEV